MKKKVLWIISMVGLCLVLYTIVVSRMESGTSVIFGGSEGAFVRTDSVNFTDLNATATPEPTVDIWPQFTTEDFENNTADLISVPRDTYARIYNTDGRGFARMLIQDVLDTTGITATAGVGTNMYLC